MEEARSTLTLSGSLGFVTDRKQTLPLRKQGSSARTTVARQDPPLMVREGGGASVRARVFRFARLIAPLGRRVNPRL